MDKAKKFSQENLADIQKKSNATNMVSENKSTVSNIVLSDIAFEIQQKEMVGETNEDKCEELKNLVRFKNGSDNKFLGILGRCSLPDCDVHTLTIDQDIIQHFGLSTTLSTRFQVARGELSIGSDSVICIMVYEDFLEAINLDGSIRKISK